MGKITCSWNKTPKQRWSFLHSVLGMRNDYLTENLSWTAYTNIILLFLVEEAISSVLSKQICNHELSKDPQHSHVFFESLTNPFPKQKILYCQSSTIVMLKRHSKSYHTNQTVATPNSKLHDAVFQCSTDLQHQKGTIFFLTGNISFKRLTPLQVHL